MYEYLVENLISYNQVDGNLRRTADRGLVSELYRRQMNALALKYFGVDSNGIYTENKEDIVAYRCPYSGEIIKELSTAHLEHILPVSSNGGTILFNCIPILNKVNLSKRDEPNLLVWWQEQDYFNYDRLERLIQYMLEAYTLVFKEPTEEELYDYDSSYTSGDYIENDDLSIDLRSKSNKTNNHSQNITYYQLLTDMINELSKNRDVSKYNSQLNNLKEQNAFGNIAELEKVIKTIQNVFKEVLGDNSKKFLSYSLKVDMNRLLKSLKTKDYESEIRKRLKLIGQLLTNNEKQIEDFFESIQDIEESNILYCDSPTQDEIDYFINNLKISHDSKINIFINMLSNPNYVNYINGKPDANNIFKPDSHTFFLENENLSIGQFWRHNNKTIILKIDEEINKLKNEEYLGLEKQKMLSKLLSAKKAIDNYLFFCNIEKRIDVFVSMLSETKYTSYINGDPDKNNIFSSLNKIPYQGYEELNGITTAQFWNSNSLDIINMIERKINNLKTKTSLSLNEQKELFKYEKAKKAIREYQFSSRPNTRMDVFIDMLSDTKYTSYINGKMDSNNIFSSYNKIPFRGYEGINGLNTSFYWQNYSDKIIERIKLRLNEYNGKNITELDRIQQNKLNMALKAIDEYNFVIPKGLNKRIDVFIEMLSDSKYTSYINGLGDDNNIFVGKNTVAFKGYENIQGLTTSNFWQSNKKFIIEKIKNEIKELNEKSNLTELEKNKLLMLEKSNRAIANYQFLTDVEKRIEVFIKMLSKDEYTGYENGVPDKNNIFSYSNEIKFLGYEDLDGVTTKQFWSNNFDKIINRIKEKINMISEKENKDDKDEQELLNYKNIMKKIDKYNFTLPSNLINRIDVFIEMLSNPKYTSYKSGIPDKNNIFGFNGKIPFLGYEDINGLNTGQFWKSNSEKIIKRINEQKLLIKNKERLTYEDMIKLQKLTVSEKAIDDYIFSSDKTKKIDIFIEMLSNPKYTHYENGKPDSNNIFSQLNEVNFKGYEHLEEIKIKGFWQKNSEQIINKINEELIKLEHDDLNVDKKLKLVLALKEVNKFRFINDINAKIDVFIDMLKQDKYTHYENGKPDSSNILSQSNTISFEGYENIDGLNTKLFWRNNKDKILERINSKLSTLSQDKELTVEKKEEIYNLKKVLEKINDYNFTLQNNVGARINVFINMLKQDKYTHYENGKPDSNNIFSNENGVSFEGYDHISGLDTKRFWTINSTKQIIPMLFYNKMYDGKNNSYINTEKDYSLPEYDSARNAVMDFLNYNRRKKKQPEFKTIDEYIDTLDKTKKDVKSLIELRDSLLLRKQQLSIENQELTEELNSSYRRAM